MLVALIYKKPYHNIETVRILLLVYYYLITSTVFTLTLPLSVGE